MSTPGEARGDLDADLSAEQLQQLATERHDLHEQIAAHPNAYPDLISWIEAVRAQREAQSAEVAEAERKARIDREQRAARFVARSSQVRREDQRAMKWAIGGGLTAVVALLMIVGVVLNRDEDMSEEATPPDITIAQPTTEPTTEVTTPGPSEIFDGYQHAHEASWPFASEEGYSFTQRIAFGDVRRGAELVDATHPGDSDVALGASCDFDPERDGVLAGIVESTSTTAGFEFSLRTSFTFADIGSGENSAESGDGRIEVEQYFTDGSDCQYLDSTANLPDSVGAIKSDDTSAAGESMTHEFFVVLRDYYSPRYPEGDRAWLDNVGFVPASTGSADDEGGSFEPDTSVAVGVTLSGRVISSY